MLLWLSPSGPSRGLSNPMVTVAQTSALRHGPQDLLDLIVEVTGAWHEKEAAEVSTAQDLSVPEVNDHVGFGAWRFVAGSADFRFSESLRH